jgi:polar amino acid transport system permease protein
MPSTLDFSFLWPFAGAFLRGVVVTIEISLWSFVLGTLAGIGVGVGLLYAPLRAVFLLLNDAVRALPPLVLIFFAYFFPYTDFGVSPPSAVWATIMALGISQAAYTADLVYHAQRNVSPRVIEGGLALALSNADIYRYLVLPDIFRQMMPAQMAFFIGIVRLSSLGAVIGAEDVVYVARIGIAQSFRSIEAWIAVGLIYIAMVVPLTYLFRRVEESKWIRRRF